MTPHLRRLTTAVTVLLITTFLIAFGVGRVTSPSEAETKAARSMSELTAFRAAEHEAFLRAKERGYSVGLINGRAAGRRAGEARGEAIRAATQTAAAVDTHPYVHPTASTVQGEEGCCPDSFAGSRKYASQDRSTGDGEESSPAMLASEDADSSRGTSTNDDGDSADHSDSSWPTDPDTTATASAEPVATARRPRGSETNWAEADAEGGAADEANHAEAGDETYDAEDTDEDCDVGEGEEADEHYDTEEPGAADEAEEDNDPDEADQGTEADEAHEADKPDEPGEGAEADEDHETDEADVADEAATSENAYSKT